MVTLHPRYTEVVLLPANLTACFDVGPKEGHTLDLQRGTYGGTGGQLVSYYVPPHGTNLLPVFSCVVGSFWNRANSVLSKHATVSRAMASEDRSL